MLSGFGARGETLLTQTMADSPVSPSDGKMETELSSSLPKAPLKTIVNRKVEHMHKLER